VAEPAGDEAADPARDDGDVVDRGRILSRKEPARRPLPRPPAVPGNAVGLNFVTFRLSFAPSPSSGAAAGDATSGMSYS
jgi:hypothetical protein